MEFTLDFESIGTSTVDFKSIGTSQVDFKSIGTSHVVWWVADVILVEA